MNATNDALWPKIESFPLDEPNDALTFTQRLARENAWSVEFARRVVEEYRRFLFLAMRAGHPVTPSDEIDQAWHLHLVYTRSYWDDLCRGILERPLHHGPTRGGTVEDDRFERQYDETKASYVRIFGHEPPSDIWPSSEVRFSPRARFARLNTAAHWMLPKQRVQRLAAACIVAALSLSALAACSSRDGGYELGDLVPLMFIGLVVMLLINAARKGGGGKGGGGCGGYGGGSGFSHDSSDSGCSHDSSGCGSSGCSSGCGGGCGDD